MILALTKLLQVQVHRCDMSICIRSERYTREVIRTNGEKHRCDMSICISSERQTRGVKRPKGETCDTQRKFSQLTPHLCWRQKIKDR